MEFSHRPVLLDEVIQALNIRPDGIYIDGTAGGGGHSSEIAKRLQSGRLLSLDKDPDALKEAARVLSPYPCAQVVRSDFAQMAQVLDSLDIEKVDGILLDLGVSSYQLDNAQRGFSYKADGPLDMRMSGEGLSAYDIVNTYDKNEIARILREYGEEKFAMRIAQAIERERAIAPIENTAKLTELIRNAIPAPARREGGHPAKRSFQALRIAVNGELDSLRQALDAGFERLAVGGRFAVITFHSLEDRIVKQQFRAYATGCTCPPDFPICVCGKAPRGALTPRKAIEPSKEEIESNRRSKSARLRVIEKR